MILVILASFTIGLFSGRVIQIRSLGENPVTVRQQEELEKLEQWECMNSARTVGEEEECVK